MALSATFVVKYAQNQRMTPTKGLKRKSIRRGRSTRDTIKTIKILHVYIIINILYKEQVDCNQDVDTLNKTTVNQQQCHYSEFKQ